MFQTTGISVGMTLASDNDSNFLSALTCELIARLGVSLKFSALYHPVSVVETRIFSRRFALTVTICWQHVHKLCAR